jgi:hypothetical protein
MRALATTGETRSLPDVPTLRESGVDIVMGNWRGMFGPPGLSAEARAALVRLMTDMNGLPAWREMMTTRGWDDAFLTGDAFAQFLARDERETADVLRDVGNGVVKAFVFGIICTVVALYQGYETEATPEGVAYATTRTVVISSLWVLGMDFVLTALMFSTP